MQRLDLAGRYTWSLYSGAGWRVVGIRTALTKGATIELVAASWRLNRRGETKRGAPGLLLRHPWDVPAGVELQLVVEVGDVRPGATLRVWLVGDPVWAP